MQGIACHVERLADKVCSLAFERGLIIETSGAEDEVIKIMPPLNIDQAGLYQGLDILESCLHDIR